MLRNAEEPKGILQALAALRTLLPARPDELQQHAGMFVGASAQVTGVRPKLRARLSKPLQMKPLQIVQSNCWQLKLLKLLVQDSISVACR